ncbi:MAG TPA: cell division protein FtsL [Gammaproteobacteria bacterium]
MGKIQGLSLVLVLAVTVSAFQVIYTKHQNRQAFIALQNLKQQQDEMETDWGKLQLEQATWAAHGRVEKIASNELEMVIPPAGTVSVIKP